MISRCGVASSPLRGSSGSPEARRGLDGPSPAPGPLAMPSLSPQVLAALLAGRGGRPPPPRRRGGGGPPPLPPPRRIAEMGYTDVRVLAGGLAAWRAAGRPTVEGLNVPSKGFGERAVPQRGTPQTAP